MTMAIAEADRLDTFKCAAGGRYRLPEEWYNVDDYGVRYLNVRGALTNLEDSLQMFAAVILKSTQLTQMSMSLTFNDH